MRVRTRDRELLTSKGWVNANFVVDLPYEEARHLLGMKKVDPVDPVDAEKAVDPKPTRHAIRKNAALGKQFSR